ncbi:hypothetical protein MMC11_007187 [Xylographa trunciseda]|nr:hypothetical protein [Xylographa trunciseda]
MERLPRRFLTGRRFIWDRAFAIRQWRSHRLEVSLIEPQPHESVVDAFIYGQKSRLDPPQYTCTALKSFLESASIVALAQIPPRACNAAKVALIDDRRDPTGWQSGGEHRGARDWDGYARYPPEGVDDYFNAVNAAELYARLVGNRQDAGAERRVMRYIANMTPLCGLAIASTVPQLRAAVLRGFLQRYIVNAVSFGVTFPFYGFALEFHMPYYALRQSIDPSRDTRGLRNCGKFPANMSDPLRPEYLYEAQISVMVTGIDEWFWTAYCCVDTYFGSEEGIEFYHDSTLDAATGGERLVSQPVWNPREYFLYILSCRFRQATKEWSIVVGTVESRLLSYEATIFHITGQAPLSDDPKFNRTREYTSTIELLRLLYNAIIKIIESWERFEDGELQYFEVEEQATLRKTWDGYIADIVKDSNELRSLRTTLRQKIETFDNMKNGVSAILERLSISVIDLHQLVNVSAMVESRVATDQGKNIGRLTRVTVFYLPLGLATAVFSMAIMPQSASWIWYAVVMMILTFLTSAVTFRYDWIKDSIATLWV